MGCFFEAKVRYIAPECPQWTPWSLTSLTNQNEGVNSCKLKIGIKMVYNIQICVVKSPSALVIGLNE